MCFYEAYVSFMYGFSFYDCMNGIPSVPTIACDERDVDVFVSVFVVREVG
jgi:hypothetical protein